MPICPTCTEEFIRLEDGVKCGVCQQRYPGISKPELKALLAKPQCAACGLAGQVVNPPLCPQCVKHYRESSGSVPLQLLRVAGVPELILTESSPASDVISRTTPLTGAASLGVNQAGSAASILSAAAEYQQSASTERLTQKPSTARGSKGGLFVHKNAEKATSIKMEKQAKREESKLLGKGIRLAATLWKSCDANSGRGATKLVQYGTLRTVVVAESTAMTKAWMDKMLESLRKEFLKKHPRARDLNWGNTTIYAHENQSKFSLLDISVLGTVNQLLQEFVKKKLAPPALLEARSLELRFVFSEAAVLTDDFDSALESAMESRAIASRKRRASQALPSHSMAPPPPPAPGLRSAQLSSRFRMPTVTPPVSQAQWTRDPRMATSAFVRTTATYNFDGLRVVFETLEPVEHIEIALDVGDGEPGLIGKGLSKMGIYARFGGREYVITQPYDLQAEKAHIHEVLHAEYALLCIAHEFKKDFDVDTAEKIPGHVPAFYFNFEGSILGELIPSGSGGKHLPHRWFIATPLLPCGPVDPPITKYTGNGGVGPAQDHLTKSIHAFVHYVLVASQGTLLLCDLQGTQDATGRICLIDPQAHTARIDPGVLKVYWNEGQPAIDAFKKEHLGHCKEENWVCDGLGLLDPQISARRSPIKSPGAKGSLSYVMHNS